MTHISLRNTVAALAFMATTAALIVTSPAAGAGTNAGVKYVHLDSEPITCVPQQSQPCPFPGDFGASNTLYVGQGMVPTGPGTIGWRYNSVRGTSPDPTVLRMGFRLSAKCRSGYALEHAFIQPGYNDDEGAGTTSPEAGGPWNGDSVPVNTSARTLSERHVEVLAPVSDMLLHHMGNTFEGMHDGQPGFDPTAWGEYLVALDRSAGLSELAARQKTRVINLQLDFHALVGCRWTHLGGWRRFMNNPAKVPIRVIFGPLPSNATAPAGPRRNPPEPPRRPTPSSRPTAPGGGLAGAAWVTQARLFAIPDTNDPCTVRLSGVLVTNRATAVRYRLVDHLGVASPVFTVQVDQTNTAYFDRPVTLSPAAQSTPNEQLTSGSNAGIGGLTAATAPFPQGWYRLDVVSPNVFTSDVSSYALPGCRTATAPRPTRVRR